MKFIDNVIPCDVKTVLKLVVNLFLEQTKVEDEDSELRDSLKYYDSPLLVHDLTCGQEIQ
jgi:hypothetical protein